MKQATGQLPGAVRAFVGDVAAGMFALTHNSFALLGLVLVFVVGTLALRGDLRSEGEARLMGWLEARRVAAQGLPIERDAIERATAADPKELPRAQAALTYWLSKKYRVAPQPIGALVAEAFEAGARARLDPTLILAVMAIESGFNPFAQSNVGAQGLMQVMTHVHTDKYENFGGDRAAFDPVSNVRVGVKVLQDCIARAGSLEGGLKHYVGAANLDDDGGYAAKVLAEHARLLAVARGRAVAPNAQLPVPSTGLTASAAQPVRVRATLPAGAKIVALADASAGRYTP